MKRVLAIVAALFLLMGPAAAQSGSIIEHYRAYQAALERDDLAAAEASATAAFEAAEAESDGRTGALAQNLATVRFLRGDAAGAIAPAQRAVALAESNAADPLTLALARLVLARAELSTGAANAAERLVAALDGAQTASAPAYEIYDAAVQLATWAQTNEQYELALRGWSSADQYAEGSRFPEQYARARAKLGRATSLVLEQSRTRSGRAYDEAAMTEAYLELRESYRLLYAYASQQLPSGELTTAQQTAAQVLAWSSVVRSKMRADGMPLPPSAGAQGDADGLSEELSAPQALTVPRCMIRPAFRREIEYPSVAASRGELAGAAVRLRINAAGEVESTTVVALVGSEEFGEAIEEARWYVERRPDSVEGCRMEMDVIWTVAFRFGGPSDPARGRTRRPN
jgi:hypothetical protein